MIQLQAGNWFAMGQQGGPGELLWLGAIDKGFQNVLLNVELVIGDGRWKRASAAVRGDVRWPC